jgi:uncharacterized protein (TIGR01777 family)
MSEHIVIAGGSGFIGRRLAAELAAADTPVTILSRRSIADVGRVSFVQWTPDAPGTWTQALEGAAAVINLCGESIAGPRWSTARKQQLLDSRVVPTRTLVTACTACRTPPRQFLQASGVGYYGIGEKERNESSGAGQDFLAALATAWEAPVRKLNAPHSILRFGVILGKRGGALPRMLMPFRAFTGGPIGSGQQWLSWIHLDDAVAAIRHLLSNSGDTAGIYNICAPNPVRNHEFADAAASRLRRPNWLPVPKTLLKLMLGEQATLVCDGQRAVPAALLREGFRFRYPTIAQALEDLIR